MTVANIFLVSRLCVIETRYSVHLELKTSGFLAVDIYDGTTGQPLWRGWAERPLDISDRKNAKTVIRQAVTSIIAQFPAH